MLARIPASLPALLRELRAELASPAEAAAAAAAAAGEDGAASGGGAAGGGEEAEGEDGDEAGEAAPAPKAAARKGGGGGGGGWFRGRGGRFFRSGGSRGGKAGAAASSSSSFDACCIAASNCFIYKYFYVYIKKLWLIIKLIYTIPGSYVGRILIKKKCPIERQSGLIFRLLNLFFRLSIIVRLSKVTGIASWYDPGIVIVKRPAGFDRKIDV